MRKLAVAALAFVLLCGFDERKPSDVVEELRHAHEKEVDAAVIASDSEWLADYAAARLLNTRNVALWHDRAQVRYLDAARAYRCQGEQDASQAVLRKCVDKLAIFPGGGAQCELALHLNPAESAKLVERRTTGEAQIRSHFASPTWRQGLDSPEGIASELRDDKLFKPLQDLFVYDGNEDGTSSIVHVIIEKPLPTTECLWGRLTPR